jgi:hypothetical protein
MSFRAPLRVPVELKRGNRWFRLAHSVSVDGLTLAEPMPDEAEGPLEIIFHLPGATAQLTCHGEVLEEIVGEGEDERAERRLVRFLDLDQASAASIQAYVQDRLGII